LTVRATGRKIARDRGSPGNRWRGFDAFERADLGSGGREDEGAYMRRTYRKALKEVERGAPDQ
jgi:hypothetical protein